MIDNFEKFHDYIWQNGEMVNPRDAKVSVMSHTMHYGSGFFEGIRAYQTVDGKTAIFRLDEHVDRLFNSARLYYIDVPFEKEVIRQAIIDVVRENKFTNCYIRPLVYVSEGFNTISITDSVKVNVMVSAWQLGKAVETVTLSVSSYRRMMSSQTPMQAKAIGNYMNSMLIRNEAKEKGDTDGIALDMDGYVSEVSTANIFLIKDGVAYTPDMSSSILNGLTRQSAITMLEDKGIKVVERKIARDELYYADEVFITGTASEIKVCTRIDRLEVGNGNYPIATNLAKQFKDVVCGKEEKYLNWLTYVD